MTPFGPDDLDAAENRKDPKPRPKGTLPHLPAGGEADEFEAWLTAAFRPPDGYRLDLFERPGALRADPCSITFRNGRDRRTFRFTRQSELMGAQLRSTVLGISDGWLRMGHLTASEVEDVWAALCIYGRVISEADDRDEAVKWMHQLLDQATALTGYTLVPDGRHDGLMRIREGGEFIRADAEQLVRGGDGGRRPTRFVDKHTDEQFIRAGETATFLWHVVGVRDLTRPGLRARLAEIGVAACRFEARQPPHPKLTLFQLTADLIEYAEAISAGKQAR